MTYLSGANSEIGKLHFGGKAKDITDKVRKLHKKIIEQNKALAKKIGAGSKRMAKFKKGVDFKVFLKAMEHNVGGIAVRLLMLYKEKPTETKDFLSRFGDWAKIKTAINKGDHFHKFTAISGDEDGAETAAGNSTGQYVEAAKASVGIIQKIIQFFKKHKKNKSSDAQVLEDMNNSIEADKSIPKVDENGKELPATSDAENEAHEQGNEGGGFAKTSFFKNPIVLGVGAAAILGVVLLARKK